MGVLPIRAQGREGLAGCVLRSLLPGFFLGLLVSAPLSLVGPQGDHSPGNHSPTGRLPGIQACWAGPAAAAQDAAQDDVARDAPVPPPQTTTGRTGGWRLADSSSTFLQRHARDRVDWYPWGPEAFARAHELDRPVFLVSGFAACHACEDLRRGCFLDAALAGQLNRDFVAILVDREDLPQVDGGYQSAVMMLAGDGGWPLVMFLTPTGDPFFGGTTFPCSPEPEQTGLSAILDSVLGTWRQDHATIERMSRLIREHLSVPVNPTDANTPPAAFLERGLAAILGRIDPRHGGFLGAPKFPLPRTWLLLTSMARVAERPELSAHATFALRQLTRSPLHDPLGGGFHRYGLDEAWQVPRFERLLHTQAHLAISFLEIGRLTVQEDLREVGREVLDAMLRDFLTDAGGFAASLGAGASEEGASFLWTPAEVRTALGGPQADPVQLSLALEVLGISEAGEFPGGRSAPRRARTLLEVAGALGLPADQARRAFASARERLAAAQRARPGNARDDKVILGWNASAVSALACGARHLGTPAYLDAAHRALAFADRTLAPETGFLRRVSHGQAQHPATLQDVALHLQAHLDLYDASFDAQHVARARRLLERIVLAYGPTAAQLAAGQGGFHETLAGAETFGVRRKDFADEALPAGNAVLARALLRLHRLTAVARYRELAEGILREGMATLAPRPEQSAELLLAALELTSPVPEVIVFGDLEHPLTRAFVREVRRCTRPFVVTAHRPPGAAGAQAAQVLPVLEGRTGTEGRPTVYLCRDFVCAEPWQDLQRFAVELDRAARRPLPAPDAAPPYLPPAPAPPTSTPPTPVPLPDGAQTLPPTGGSPEH